MTAFGTFAPHDQGTTDTTSGKMPADIGLAGKANLSLVEQAWSYSPANFIKPASLTDLPATGYGAGPRARLDNAILQNYESSVNPTIRPVETAAQAAPAAPAETKSLRSILSPLAAPTASRPGDLIEALAPSGPSYDVRNPSFLPGSPFAPNYGAVEARTAQVAPAAGAETGPLPAAFGASPRTESWALPPAVAAAAHATGPLPTVAKLDAPASPAAGQTLDLKNHPLFANINKEAKSAPAYAMNNRMETPVSMEALSRKLMNADFSAPKAWVAQDSTRAKPGDPFAAENCYQSWEFSPDGTVRTTTTLPDLSASKIEAVYADRSRNVTLADNLGRSTVDQRFDATGQLVSHTDFTYGHEGAPLVPSAKVVRTATQTIETQMNATGTVVASKIMPYSGLNANQSIA